MHIGELFILLLGFTTCQCVYGYYAPYRSVTSYGAKGDGVTDDTTSIITVKKKNITQLCYILHLFILALGDYGW